MKKEKLDEILESRKSLIVSGDAQSGKTTNIVFPLVDEMINKKESMFILDSKEEYLNQYYDKLKLNDYNIVIINLKDLSKSEGWNPLKYPYSLYKKGDVDLAIEYIKKITKTIYDHDIYEDFDSFALNLSSDLTVGLILSLFEDAKEDEVNFNSVNQILYDDLENPTYEYCTKYFNQKGKKSPAYAYASTTMLSLTDIKNGIISLSNYLLGLYTKRESVSKLLNKTTFEYEKLFNKPSAIFIINNEEWNYLKQISIMFIEQLHKVLLDNEVNNKFNFIIDNADVIQINDFLNMLNSSLKSNIKFILETKSLKELKEKYGNSITTICNYLNITNDNIEFSINNQNSIEEKNFKEVIIEEKNIEYPNINNDTIKIFDIKKFLTDDNLDDSNPFANLAFDSEISNNDNQQLLDRIDEAIKELEDEISLEDEKNN